MTATSDLRIPSTRARHSTIPTIQRSGGPLRDALVTLPEWRETVERLMHLDRVRPAPRRLASLEVEIEEILFRVAESRGTFDAEAVAAHAALVRDQQSTEQAVQTAFDAAGNRYVEELDTVVRAQVTTLYRHLTGQLVDVIDRARQHADLVDAGAEDAIASDQVRQWQAVNDLRARFRSIRAAYGQLNQHIGGTIEHLEYFEVQWISNPAEAWDDWAPWRANGAIVNPANVHDRTELDSPWPDPRTGVKDLADGWFSWLVRTPEAQPWAPSPRQHDEAARALFPLVQEARAGQGRTRKARAIR
jgi:hypothetical protein